MSTRTGIVIFTALLAIAAFVAGASWYGRAQQEQGASLAAAHAGSMERPHSPVLGPAAAPVTIVEFLDPACEACRAFHPHVKQILRSHPERVRLVIRYAPFHGDVSVTGVRILEAARRQGRFEPVLDALMRGQPVWASHGAPAPERAWEFAREAGLELGTAREFNAGDTVEKMLEQEVADLQAVGVRFTPTFFVNGQPLAEPDPAALLRMVEEALGEARAQ